MQYLTFDITEKVAPIPQFHDAPCTHEYTKARILEIALPVLALYQPIGALAHGLSMGISVARDWKKCSTLMELFDIIIRVAAIAGLVFNPVLTSTIAHTAAFALHFFNACAAHKPSDMGKRFLLAAYEGIYVAAKQTAHPFLVAVSLLSQAAMVYKNALNQDVRNPEKLVNCFLVSLKLYGLKGLPA